ASGKTRNRARQATREVSLPALWLAGECRNSNAQRSTSNAQRSIIFLNSMLDVRRWLFDVCCDVAEKRRFVPSFAFALVSPPRARSSLAPNTRPVPRIGFRGHASANPDRHRPSVLQGMAATIPDDYCASARIRYGRPARVARTWLLRTRGKSPQSRQARGGSTSRAIPEEN